MDWIKKDNKIIKSTLVITSLICGLLFVVCSFYEKRVMEFFVQFFAINVIKYISLLWYKFGSLIVMGLIFPAFFYVICIYLLYLCKKHRILNSFYLNRRSLTTMLVFIYILIVLIVNVYMGVQQILIFFEENQINRIYEDINSSNAISAHFLYSLFTTGLADILAGVIVSLLNLIIYFGFIFPKIDNNELVKNYYIKPFLTMMIFVFISYFFIFIIKHVFGRPIYINTAWTKEQAIENGLNPNLSIEAWFDSYGWSHLFNPQGLENGKYSNASYFNWWEINNLNNNWHNFWRWPESWVDINADHYWDMDFPSGHVLSFCGLLAGTYTFYFSKYYKIHKRFSLRQKALLSITILLLIISCITLMIQMFHWPTDVLFSIMLAPIVFYFAIKIVSLLERNKWFVKLKFLT